MIKIIKCMCKPRLSDVEFQTPGVRIHAFYPRTGEANAGRFKTLSPVCSMQQVLGQSKLYSETVSQTTMPPKTNKILLKLLFEIDS